MLISVILNNSGIAQTLKYYCDKKKKLNIDIFFNICELGFRISEFLSSREKCSLCHVSGTL